jgi:LacI family transcriptional regulator
LATIKEIARLAGVSRGTVDRVINKRGIVNPETEAKVREVVKQLEYTPNRVAQALAIKKNELVIGVVLFGGENPFFNDLIKGINKITKSLADYGCKVLTTQTKNTDPTEQLEAIDRLLEKGINGLVISPYNDEAIAEKINSLADAGIPVITTNTDIENSKRLCYVGSNYYVSGKTAGGLMSLFTRGEANIGIVTGFFNVLCHTERVAGFRRVIKKHNGMNVIAEVEGHDDDFKCYSITKQLINEHPEINALFISAAGVLGVCRAVMDLGLVGKIVIITYDDIPNTKKLLQDGVISATICQQPDIQGEKPVSLLFDYLAYGKKPSADFYYTDSIIKINENL